MSIPPPSGTYPPQPPYGQGPAPHPAWPPQRSVNGLAVAAFVLGLLCFLPAVGLVLGLVALGQIRRKGERGKGFAVAGSALSAVGLVLWALALGTGALSDAWQGFRDAARGEGTAYALAEGQCFTTPSGSLRGVTYDVDTVPCDEEHDGEVFAVFDLPAGRFPGDAQIARRADEQCYGAQDGYAMDRWALPADVDVYHLAPTARSWRTGDREVVCLFGNTDERGTLTGSLRNDATTLDRDQQAFLLADNAVNRALDQVPEAESAEDDLGAYRVWAGQVSEALLRQNGMLRRHGWDAGVEGPVTARIEDLEAAQREWSLAAKATDAATYDEHFVAGYDLLEAGTAVTARKALGLETRRPDQAEGGGDGGDGSGVEV
ncbi:hypothetical protein DN402_12800 [Streptomyces sp. SW4]|nr:hypothetical protein DN402_12800 [Streptomyces sp. SW4]